MNAPGTELPRDAVTLPTVDTSEATLQDDLFAPPASGGPPEPWQCEVRGSTEYDKTVWYAFHPDTTGRVDVSATGFDAVVAVLLFSSPARRTPQGFECVNDSDGLVERLELDVEAGTAYAVQVGGVRDAFGVRAGAMQIGIHFEADRDGDGIPGRRRPLRGAPPAPTAARRPWRSAPGSRRRSCRTVAFG